MDEQIAQAVIHRARSRCFATILLALLLGQIVLSYPTWAQEDVRFEQYSPREEQHWKDVLRRQPRNSQAYYHLGRYYEYCKRVQDAAEMYRQATLIDRGSALAYFGLGKASVIDSIEVKWPTTQKIETFTHIPANQILTIKEGSGIIKKEKFATLPGKI